MTHERWSCESVISVGVNGVKIEKKNGNRKEKQLHHFFGGEGEEFQECNRDM